MSSTAGNEPERAARLRRLRHFRDRLARVLVSGGGMAALVALLLIFFYLFSVVWPLFGSASMTGVARFTWPEPGATTVWLGVDEYGDILSRVVEGGEIRFHATRDGALVGKQALPVTPGRRLTRVVAAEPGSDLLAAGFDDGGVLVFRITYTPVYQADGQRRIEPGIEYPLGKEPFPMLDPPRPVAALALGHRESSSTLAAAAASGDVALLTIARERGFLDEEERLSLTRSTVAGLDGRLVGLLVDQAQRLLTVATFEGEAALYDISRPQSPQALGRVRLVAPGEHLTSIQYLSGTQSLLAGESTGRVGQWFPVRDERGSMALRPIRSFPVGTAPIVAVQGEARRKGFVAITASDELGVFNATAERRLIDERLAPGEGGIALALGPRADVLAIERAEGAVGIFRITNEHPEVSVRSLWQRVWYEGYERPDWTWQSSAATSDFEPKFSLAPLTFGTLKAAFYALLFAAPLAIFGAIYTAYFMTPAMRQFVKPSVEIMAALPTVVLGFLAGLWLAPALELNLAGVFLMFLLLPPGTLFVGYGWRRLPATVRHRVPDGWQAALLVVPLLAIGWLAIALGHPVEQLLFGGDLRAFLVNDLGIAFDQRNSLVVGIAMGFAVVPVIFSIAEDAIFSVPRSLTQGSLALGATPWQTFSRVVLLTASPGIFSALMIGLGRAVGETMIVLMATGNTPVMDFSIFQGMRTLAANVAVEMPEAEVDSTHYRVLFLAALVLFVFTFVLNTVADIVRHRLRKRYGNL